MSVVNTSPEWPFEGIVSAVFSDDDEEADIRSLELGYLNTSDGGLAQVTLQHDFTGGVCGGFWITVDAHAVEVNWINWPNDGAFRWRVPWNDIAYPLLPFVVYPEAESSERVSARAGDETDGGIIEASTRLAPLPISDSSGHVSSATIDHDLRPYYYYAIDFGTNGSDLVGWDVQTSEAVCTERLLAITGLDGSDLLACGMSVTDTRFVNPAFVAASEVLGGFVELDELEAHWLVPDDPDGPSRDSFYWRDRCGSVDLERWRQDLEEYRDN